MVLHGTRQREYIFSSLRIAKGSRRLFRLEMSQDELRNTERSGKVYYSNYCHALR